jgi:hypothetical protein
MRYLIILLMLTGCAHSLQDRKDSSIYTLSVNTGLSGENLYERTFKREAQEKCPFGYESLEKTHTPSTLDSSVIDDHYFYWVIRCK